ncbi:S9 family peptidase [Aureibacter tunicatorum]|uniref:Dipeptidyl-peptidase-4 n=1 Tax=Aureibacter tunicatorum TaxID=866807 RepID=A0AAE3XLT7_9BACT|nr:S9 family peptidase [Aureibacter tunicatorum]MDR6237304.1 dipeptidyl-peptidase-4 [Aureibacter tunicatorum]BDD06295.1 peptidase S9 [Aureibacter tunicatorum]
MKHFVHRALLTAFLSLWFMSYSSAQLEHLDFDKIYNQGYFSSNYFGPAKWLDGKHYTTLESSEYASKGRDIVQYNAESGKRTVLVSAVDLIPNGESIPLKIKDYSWSESGEKLLIFTNTKRVWRYHTKGDYWVYDVKSKQLTFLGGDDAEPSTMMFAKLSPDAKKVAYVRLNNIYMQDLETMEISSLTQDGSKHIINGTFDWVYEEELDCRDGFRWSPDGSKIAYWQLDSEEIRSFSLIDNTSSNYSKVIDLPYPKVGEQNSSARIGIVDINTSKTKWLPIEGDSREHYLARMYWTPNSESLMIQQLNRKQNQNKLLLADADASSVKNVYTEVDEAWVAVYDDFMWLDHGKKYLWSSEKDGWKHVYVGKTNGGDQQVITPYEFDVISISLVDEKGGWIYYVASPQNATQRYLFKSRLDGKGKPRRITPVELDGTNKYQIAPNAKWAIHKHSSFTEPEVTSVVRMKDHHIERTLVDNAALRDKIDKMDITEPEFFQVRAEGVDFDGWMIKPVDFDESKKYPVLFFVYGEPAFQTVLDKWTGEKFLFHNALAREGYIVISIDNRGTPAPKGREWRKSIYQKLGVINVADQAAAAKEIAKWDFIDANRMAIWGWSGGGASTLNCMFKYPEVYKVGMAVAPVTDHRLYDNIYQERYMGLINESPEKFFEGSAVNHASGLKGKLLVVHGTGDDNVHYQHTEVLIDELVKHNKLFSLMSYPNRTHGIWEGENTSRHVREVLKSYLKENLKPGPLQVEN